MDMSDIAGGRVDLIAKYKREVENKTYKVKSEEIAQKIAQALKEEENIVRTTKKGARWTV